MGGDVLNAGDYIRIPGLLNYFLGEITAINGFKIEVYVFDYVDFVSGQSLLPTIDRGELSFATMMAGVRLNSSSWISASSVLRN